MTIFSSTFTIPYAGAIKAIIFSNLHAHVLYVLTEEALLLNVDTSSNEINWKRVLDKGEIDWSKSICLKLSEQDEYMTIANELGQYGYVYDLAKNSNIFTLDRKEYHVDKTCFPLAFFSKNDQVHLIHGTDWNHLEITNLVDLQTLTKRDTNVYKNEFYLDYFYGELHLSPNQKWLASSGWIWQPASLVKFINLQNWLNTRPHEPELSQNSDFCIISYYWDRAMCWVSDTSIAYLYDPQEEGADKEDCQRLKIEQDKSYIFLFDCEKNELIQRIPFDYPKNEYHEARPDCKLFFMDRLYFFSNKGMSVIDIKKGKIVEENLGITATHFMKKYQYFYRLIERKIQYFHIS